MPYLSVELHLWWLEWIIWRNLNIYYEYASLIRRIFLYKEKLNINNQPSALKCFIYFWLVEFDKLVEPIKPLTMTIRIYFSGMRDGLIGTNHH